MASFFFVAFFFLSEHGLPLSARTGLPLLKKKEKRKENVGFTAGNEVRHSSGL